MKVEIYGTSWCGYCKNAVALCETKAIEYDYIDVDDTSNLRLLEERIGEKIRSVPQIFLDNEYVIGGFRGLEDKLNK